MKQILKIISVGILALFVFFGVNTTRAQTADDPAEIQMEVIKVSTVNIYNAENTKLNNRTYSISFALTNREGIQPDIRYGIQLIRKYGSKPIDMYLANEAITLGEEDAREITIEYTIPNYIPDGIYRMLIVAQNQNGMLLATSPIGFPEKDITIENSSGLNIDKCYLRIAGEDPDTKYAFGEGVTINAKEEKLTASCEVTNNTSKSDELKLQLITHKRDQLGDILANNILEQIISVKGKSSQTISFEVPVLSTPQAYDIDTFLINSKGEKVSYSVFLHYVVSGISATIQNTILDKTNYENGDVANLKVLWTASADTFTSSRLPGADASYVIKGEIKNSTGEVCGASSKNTKTPENVLGEDTLNISINRECPQAIAEVSITDSEGNILDTTKIDLNNPVTDVQINANIPTAAYSFANFKALYTIIFIVVLALIAYGILLLRKQKVEKNK